MSHRTLGARLLLVSLVVVLLVVAAACGGTAAEPAAPAAAPTTPAAAPEATAVPAAAAEPTEAPPAAMTEDTGGKITLMNAVWATELFTPRDGVGETATYGRQMHAFWINGNENLEMVPGVLTDWSVSDDGLSWDLTLRDGIVFHNGDPLTIDDAMFTMEFTFGPEAVTESISPSIQAEAAETASIEATGPNTLRVTHTSPKAFFPFFISDLSFGIAGVLLPKTYFESLGQDGYNDAPIGAGPFRLASLTQQLCRAGRHGLGSA